MPSPLIGYLSQRVRFYEKLKMMKSPYLVHFYVVYENVGDFFWNVYQTLTPCQNCPTDQPAKPDKYYQPKYLKVLIKRPPVATIVRSSTNTIIEALGYLSLSSDLQSRPEQSSHLQGLRNVISLLYSLSISLLR